MLVRVLLHLRHHQLLVQGAAVDADANRLAVVDRHLADGRELLVAPGARAHVAGIDAVLVECGRAVRVARQEQVPVVVEVADERRRAPGIEHPLLDLGHGRGGDGDVHRDAHHLRSGFPQLDHLSRRCLRIGSVGHGHRLDDHGRPAADLYVADLHAYGLVELQGHTRIIAVQGRRTRERPTGGHFWRDIEQLSVSTLLIY